MLPERDLVRQGLPLVRVIARRLARRLGGYERFEDLLGMGNLALLDVARSYDPARAGFQEYASTRLTWAILDEIRREAHSRSSAAKMLAVIASERYATFEDDATEDAPQTLEQDQQALREALDGHAAALAFALLTSRPDPALLPQRPATPEDEILRAETAKLARRVIDGLPDQQRAIMDRHYYGGASFPAIARELGITRSWANRLHAKALDALASAMKQSDGPPPDEEPPDPRRGQRRRPPSSRERKRRVK